MNFRTWLFTKLTTASALIAIVPAESVKAGGSVTSPPVVRPFVIYRLQENRSRMNNEGSPLATSQTAEVWAYDEPGSYMRIDSYLAALRSEITGQVLGVEGGIACEWTGDSPELADDELKSAVRFATFQLTGRVAA